MGINDDFHGIQWNLMDYKWNMFIDNTGWFSQFLWNFHADNSGDSTGYDLTDIMERWFALNGIYIYGNQ